MNLHVAKAARARGRRVGPWALGGALLLAGAGAIAAEDRGPVRLSARTDKAEVTVGEAFEVEVEASGPAGATYGFPPVLKSDAAELVSLPASSARPPSEGSGQTASPGGLPPNQHRYEARVFALGEASLPRLTVSWRLADGTQGEAEAPALTMKVASLLPKGEEQSPIADIRPPVSVGIAPAFFVALALALAVLGALVHALWRRLPRSPAEIGPAPVPDLPPDQEALRALQALAGADHFGRGDGRGYYIALAAVAKRYLERRLGAPVLEMTTAEMLAFLRESGDREPLAGVMRDVALAADQVKFARGDALREEGERHLAGVRAMVGDLEARLRPAPAPGAEEGKAA